MQKHFFALACISILFFVDVMALDAPAITSTSHPAQGNWYNQGLIKLEWEPVEDATRYYYIRDENPDTTPTASDEYTEEAHKSFSIGKDGTYYFHVSAAKGTNMGPAAHYEVKLDLSRPDWTEGTPLTAKPTKEGNIELSWSVAEDEHSGVDYYEIYRDTKFDFDVRAAARKYSPVFGTSYLDTNNMSQEITFFYIILAVDKAGNQSRVSNKTSATTYAFCDINISFDASLSVDKQKLVISIQADQDIYGAGLSATLPGGQTTEFFSNETLSTYTTEFDLSETVEGLIKLDLAGRERLGDDCSQGKSFIYDVTAPDIEIVSPELNETVSEEFKVKANVSDSGSYKSGISSVEFLVRTEDWESIGEMTPDTNGMYSIDWNTFNFDNGRHQIKAVAKDSVGNTTEHSSGAIVFNTLYQRGDAEAAVASAELSKQNALEFIDSLKKQNVLSDSIDSMLAAADDNLSKAGELFDVGGNEYTNARAFAKRAQEIWDSVQEQVVLEKIGEREFVYNKEQVAILLNASPLEKALVQEAQLLIEASSPQRRLEVLKVVDGNSTYYRASIVVGFSVSQSYFDEKDLNFLNVIEFVPKEFAQSAEELYSYYEFVIVQGDPIIQFRIDRGQAAEGSLFYGLNRNLSEEEANALLENNIINKYLVPPILLGAAPSISPLSFSLPALELPFGLDFAFLLGILVIVVVLAAVILGLILYSKRKKRKELDLSIFE